MRMRCIMFVPAHFGCCIESPLDAASGGQAMADDRLQITVSYSGREKRIPLVAQPSIELSDFEVDQAELELCGIVRHIFNIPAEAGFCLYEAETDRALTKESFRDPSYITAFPKFWYLTVEKTASEAAEEEEAPAGDKVRAQPHHVLLCRLHIYQCLMFSHMARDDLQL